MKTENTYEHAKIYKLVDNTNDNIYIGSTCKQVLKHRLWQHKKDFNKHTKNPDKYDYTTSFKILKNKDCKIVLLEDVNNCKSKIDLSKRERYYIETLPNVINKVIPGRTEKEYRQLVYKCGCGTQLTLHHKARHEKSQKHKDYIFKEALKDCLLSNMTLKQTREKLKHLI